MAMMQLHPVHSHYIKSDFSHTHTKPPLSTVLSPPAASSWMEDGRYRVIQNVIHTCSQIHTPNTVYTTHSKSCTGTLKTTSCNAITVKEGHARSPSGCKVLLSLPSLSSDVGTETGSLTGQPHSQPAAS